MEWYDWRNVRETLVTFGRAIQGVSPYPVVIEPDRRRLRHGALQLHAATHRCEPDGLPGSDAQGAVRPDQGAPGARGRAPALHHAGRREGRAALVANCLEDERVERLMSDGFAGLRPLVSELSRAMCADAQPLDPRSDSPGQVLAALLMTRWSERAGTALKGKPVESEPGALGTVLPLAREAWAAPDTGTVNALAERIVEILGLTEEAVPEWVLDLLERLGGLFGERDDDDPAESGDAGVRRT